MASGVYGLRLLGEPRVRRLALGMVLGLVLAYRAVQVVAWTSQIQWGYDFSAYWAAARSLLEGGSPYAAAQLAGPYSPQQQFLYLYPPPFAGLLVPFAAVLPADPRLVNWLWFGLGFALVIGAVLAVARAERLGNVHLELLGLLALAWLGIRRATPGGEVLAGAAIGAAALLKVFPGLLLVWLVLSRRYRGVATAIGAIAVLTLVSLPFTGLGAWLDYPTVLANLGPPVDTTDALAPTVWLATLLPFGVARWVVTGAGLMLVALLALAVRRSGLGGAPAPAPSLAASFGAAVAIAVLVAPALYQHYLALLVLPLLLGLAAGVHLRWLALAYVLLWGGQQPALGDLAWVVNRAFPTAGALVLAGATVVRALDRSLPQAATVRSA